AEQQRNQRRPREHEPEHGPQHAVVVASARHDAGQRPDAEPHADQDHPPHRPRPPRRGGQRRTRPAPVRPAAAPEPRNTTCVATRRSVVAAPRSGSFAQVRNVLVLPSLLFVAGIVAAVGALALNRALPGAPLAGVLRFDPSTARTLLATGAGSVLSIAAFTFWMRMVVVQLVTSTFSPRLLAQFLEDRFQRVVMASMIGAFAFVVTVLREVPAEGTPADVPQLAVGLATIVIGLAAVGILVSIRVSVHALDNGRLVDTIASTIHEVIDTAYPSA